MQFLKVKICESWKNCDDENKFEMLKKVHQTTKTDFQFNFPE